MCFLRSLLGGFRFTQWNSPAPWGGGAGGGRTGVCGVSGGGTTHTVAFTAGLKRPFPSPPHARGTPSPSPQAEGRKGRPACGTRGSFVTWSLASAREGGEGGALFCAAGSGDSRGAGRGGLPFPARVPVHVALGAVGSKLASAASRAARHERPSAPRGRVWGKLPQDPAGAVGGRRGRKGQGGHNTSQNHIQRAPPRCARKGRPCSL